MRQGALYGGVIASLITSLTRGGQLRAGGVIHAIVEGGGDEREPVGHGKARLLEGRQRGRLPANSLLVGVGVVLDDVAHYDTSRHQAGWAVWMRRSASGIAPRLR